MTDEGCPGQILSFGYGNWLDRGPSGALNFGLGTRVATITVEGDAEGVLSVNATGLLQYRAEYTPHVIMTVRETPRIIGRRE